MKIPKLCIQLLIETREIHLKNRPRPGISVSRAISTPGSGLSPLRDNGPGFDPEVDRHLRAQMDEILKYSKLPSLELDGMGILNIFIRFYLLFGKPFCSSSAISRIRAAHLSS